MRKINISNPEELKKFRQEITGFTSNYGFPYSLDDLTDKGGNYTIYCPLRWKQAFSPAKLRKLLKEDVDADYIKVEYIDFVQETAKEKTDQKRRRLRSKKIKRLSDSDIAKVVKEFGNPVVAVDNRDELLGIIDCNAGRIAEGMEKWLEHYNKGEWICCGFV